MMTPDLRKEGPDRSLAPGPPLPPPRGWRDAAWIRPAERVLLVMGLFALLGPGLVYLEAALYQVYQSSRLSARAGRWDGARGGPARVERGDSIGRIEIPRLGMSAVIREGIDTHTLLLAVGHLPGTALPGEKGNVVVGGHRDSFFRGLRKIQVNDSIRIVTRVDTFHYRVESTSVVLPERTDLLASTGTPELTLVTCYPFGFIGPAPKRFIVRARQVEGGPRPPV